EKATTSRRLSTSPSAGCSTSTSRKRSPRPWHGSGTAPTASQSRRARRASDLHVLDVDVGQAGRPRDSMRVEQLQAEDEIARADQIEPVAAGQPLDRSERDDVALRVQAAVGGGAAGDDEAKMLIHHQRARMGG